MHEKLVVYKIQTKKGVRFTNELWMNVFADPLLEFWQSITSCLWLFMVLLCAGLSIGDM
jgi:hypothetical protein